MQEIIDFIVIGSRSWVIKLIKLYQKTLSFDHGFFKFLYPHGFCRFKPTCSEYAIGSIEKFGLIRGGIKGFWRIMRCNPWSKGGYDPVLREKK
ncbi:MAG: membrane protein insertion efficiency factor YidD [Parcubacteria group bacterium CG10_big_fil_rev_8_21_14_0_10_36_14]|nr:MAG: membrane protein insertion efficiency factor YidD [Parcubacteria group bacterium CG10_big_fil_rev_8_21_14_0_10_36_14]